MKQSEVIEIVGMIVAGFPHGKLDAMGAKVYRDNLVDLPVEPARAAVIRLLRTVKFTPSIAEIRAAAVEQEQGAPRTGEEAYAEVLEAVRRHGRDYGQGMPKFRDPLIARCIGVWGAWNDLCASPSDDPGGRSRFIEMYEGLSRRGREAAASGIPLPAPANDRPAFFLPVLKSVPTGQDKPVAEPRGGGNPNPPQPFTPADLQWRRYSADEIEEAMKGAR